MYKGINLNEDYEEGETISISSNILNFTSVLFYIHLSFKVVYIIMKWI